VQKIRFEPLEGKAGDYRSTRCSPRILPIACRHTGWIGDYKGVPVLFAEP